MHSCALMVKLPLTMHYIIIEVSFIGHTRSLVIKLPLAMGTSKEPVTNIIGTIFESLSTVSMSETSKPLTRILCAVAFIIVFFLF